jgi:hypothetical protein
MRLGQGWVERGGKGRSRGRLRFCAQASRREAVGFLVIAPVTWGIGSPVRLYARATQRETRDFLVMAPVTWDIGWVVPLYARATQRETRGFLVMALILWDIRSAWSELRVGCRAIQ